MIKSGNSISWVLINHAAEAFESALSRDTSTNLAEFLPDQSDVHFLPILTELIRIDMELRWPNPGCLVESYLHRFPEIKENEEALQEIALEEYRQREQAGEQPDPAEYRMRYGLEIDPQSASLGGLPPTNVISPLTSANVTIPTLNKPNSNDCYPKLEDEDPAEKFPTIGEELCGFRLLTELGRGVYSRVFLARQGDLSGRFVVLKVARGLFGESQLLAQLQHTNIVPIYSTHRADKLEVLCMPYFGSLTLQHLVNSFTKRGELPSSGHELITTLSKQLRTVTRKQDVQSKTKSDSFASQPKPSFENSNDGLPKADAQPFSRSFPGWFVNQVKERSYEDSILWMGKCLADGLTHAHQHGILHLDLKPANVLLTDDGQPMLLDFNLATDTVAKSTNNMRIGGTLPYMSPEHLRSIRTNQRQQDERTDIYCLGILLYQMLTGQLPFQSKKSDKKIDLKNLEQLRKLPPEKMRRLNPKITPAMEAIVLKCMEPDPKNRYASAKLLAEDLQRQIDNRPLKNTPEPSFRERTAKWIRRHPRLTTVAVLLLIASTVIGTLGYGLTMSYRERDLLQTEKQELESKNTQLTRIESEKHQLRLFRKDFRTIRYLLHKPHPTREEMESGVKLCQENLQRFKALTSDPKDVAPSWMNTGEQETFRREVGEHLYLLVRTSMNLCGLTESLPKLTRWTKWNRQAQQCFPTDCPLALVRQEQQLKKFSNPVINTPEILIRKNPSDTDLYMAASESLNRGKYGQARNLARRLVKANPQHFWGWLLNGYAEESVGNIGEANNCYTVAIALQPTSPWPHYLRGLIRYKEQDYPAAQEDFAVALKHRPNWWEPCFAMALSHLRLKQHEKAGTFFTKALDAKGPSARIYLFRSRAWRMAKKLELAEQDLQTGLQQTPIDELDWVARGLARLSSDPQTALADFNQALKRNPNCKSAMQNKAHVLSERLNNPQEALQTLDRLVDRYPDYLRGRGGKAILLARLGKRKEAIQEVNECLARKPNPEILFQLGSVFAQTSKVAPQDAERAIEFVRQAVKQGWGHEYLRKDPDLQPIRALPAFRNLEQSVKFIHNP